VVEEAIMLITFLFIVSFLFSSSAYADGACCNIDYAACFTAPEDVCLGGGGIYYGDGSDCIADAIDCDTTEPDPILGACCVDGTCINAITEDDCSHSFGTWYSGSDCTDIGAECVTGDTGFGDDTGVTGDTGDTGDTGFGLELGACCVDGTCIDAIPEDECKSILGTWYGSFTCIDIGSECDTGTDPDLGACCREDECIETTAEECWAAQGAFYGPGSSCDDEYVECCTDIVIDEPVDTDEPIGTTDTVGTDEPIDPTPAVACSSTGQSRGGLNPMFPLAMIGLAAGLRRRETR
jgi:MYXO-CTERM domain-containing protein